MPLFGKKKENEKPKAAPGKFRVLLLY